MTAESKLKECSFFLVRYVPDLVRDEFLNIGLFLHSPEEDYFDCLFTDDLRRIKRFHQQADLEFLRELQPYFEQQIKERETEIEDFLKEMQESFSNVIQVSPPRPCRLQDPQAEMQELFGRYVGTRLAGPPAKDTRMRIRQRLHGAFESAGVLGHKLFEKNIPAEQWTTKGDPLRFDFGYKPLPSESKRNGRVKLIHALSLKRDADLAKVLAYTIVRVRDKEPAELTAVVEGLPAAGDEAALFSQRALEEVHIRLQPLATVDAFAQGVLLEMTG
jgi:DUF3037 family protein